MSKKKELSKYGNGERGIFKIDPKSRRLVPVETKTRKQVHEIITDDLKTPIRSLATFDSPTFTSKSAYRRHLKANGFKETGGEHLNEKPPTVDEREADKQFKDELEKDYQDIKNDRVPFTEAEKEQHRREERQWGNKYKIKPQV